MLLTADALLVLFQEQRPSVDIKEKVVLSLWCPLVKAFELKVNSGLALFVTLVAITMIKKRLMKDD